MSFLLTAKNIRANLVLLFVAVVWGFAFVAQVQASSIGSFLYNGIRYMLGALVLIPVVILVERKKITWSVLAYTLRGSFLCSLIMFFAVNLQQYGILYNQNAGKAGFITGLYIVFVPIASIFIKKEGKNTAFTWISAIIALVGLFLVSIPSIHAFSVQGLIGDGLVLIGAFFWTAHILLTDRYAKETCPLLFAFLQFACCGFLCLIVSLFVDEISWSVIREAGLPILYGGLVSVGLGYTLQILGQRDAKPTLAAITLSCEAVFAAIGGVLILHETMTARQLIGTVLMLAAIFLAQYRPREKEKTVFLPPSDNDHKKV